MRSAHVFRNKELAGILTKLAPDSYVFRYEDAWFRDGSKPAISLTLPKTQQEYHSNYLFPFFFNIISEGVNKRLQSQRLRIDEKDYFGILVATTDSDTIGAVTLSEIIGSNENA